MRVAQYGFGRCVNFGTGLMYDYYPMFNYFKETGRKTNGGSGKENGKRL
jgi:hypothetical protein